MYTIHSLQHTTLYRRFTNREREEISRSLAAGIPQVDIARKLNRRPATISREIKRNIGKHRREYLAFTASRKALVRASSRRLGKSRLSREKRLRAHVRAGLSQEWSPREIQERLKREYSLDMRMRVSHEAIYRYICVLPRGILRKTLIRALRQEHKYRRKKGYAKMQGDKGKIADMLSIEEHPEDVADRSVPGHWEGDMIIGKHKKTALGTLVERATRYTILVPLGRKKDAISVRKTYARAFHSVPRELKKNTYLRSGQRDTRAQALHY